ncbi:MAG: 3-methyl-2-oxobutanoate hydroxymethyltransferase [Clostridiales bacterium]|nr:3-methyl-2-oxobutanoate hydroxymethyltransferase [Clostridiales bacterium]
MPTTVQTFAEAKRKKTPLTMLTCYDYSTAKLINKAGIDSILVGDSLGNTILGYPNTLPVTLDDMIHHCRAVTRGAPDCLVVCDMPFMSYETGVYDAVVNAGRLMKEGGADAVKLEGGRRVAAQIRAIVEAGIPVQAHIGLTPQSINALGGFKVQGKDTEAAAALLADARAVEAAGAFSVVIECVPAPLAKAITEILTIPTIGIGAGADCDGQVLVYQDMLGMYSDFVPKFVRQFAQLGEAMTQAFQDYATAVKDRTFPNGSEIFTMDASLVEAAVKEFQKGDEV